MRDGGISPSSRIVAHGRCSHPLSPAVTLFELLPAAARARIIPAGFGERGLQLRIFGSVELHDLRRRPIAAQQLRHRAHGAVDVFEERHVARAQIVQPILAVRGRDEPVLGTPAVAGKAHDALPAIARQRVQLILAELALLG